MLMASGLRENSFWLNSTIWPVSSAALDSIPKDAAQNECEIFR
jgi:hypothetical protein